MEFSVTTAHPGDRLWVQNLLLLATSTSGRSQAAAALRTGAKEGSQRGARGRVHRFLEAVYQEAETRSANSASFVFLGHVFDGVQQPIYIDEFHGNQTIAHAISQTVQFSPHSEPRGTPRGNQSLRPAS